MKRRKIGPAYERSPFERFSEWTQRNLLALFSGAVISLIYLLLINFLVNYFIPFLSSGASDTRLEGAGDSSPLWLTVKILGTIIIFIILFVTRMK
tara:strand:- start:32 stop:316 length:285 start_codon:yes stop_codon:yes gene_type:complete